jgi:CheY-like chemotaxis protein
MKLLIIAGPYDADRIRKAALSAGFETVAVEPGESLSGWITASRPELIVMATQIVHADPVLALSKVRAVPRGRVPIFLVGDAADEERLRDLADGFFVRPVAPELLLERARAILSPSKVRATGARRAVDALEKTELGLGPPAPRSPRSGAPLKPLMARSGGSARGAAAGSETSARLAELDAGIDALFDAELSQAVAAGPGPRRSALGSAPGSAPAGGADVQADLGLDGRPGQSPGFEDQPTRTAQPSAVGVAPHDAAAEGERTRLLARYAPVEEGDYFAVLGVGRDASPGEARRAHERIIQELASDAIGPALARELAHQIDAIRAVASEALRVLTDDGLRPRYLSNLPR